MVRRLIAPIRRFADAIRAGDWWNYKFGPVLLLFYLSAVEAGVSILSLWRPLIELLGAITVSAVFVSVINDWTDRGEDRAANKRNRFDGATRPLATIAFGLSITLGAAFAWLWRSDIRVLGCFAGTWLAFTLYSVPPVRLKARGAWGVVADAAGSNLFPGMLAIALAWSFTAKTLPIESASATGCWIFAFGLRGILWHQLVDEQADRVSNAATFVQRHGRLRAVAVATWIVLPIEIVAMAILLWQLGLVMPVVALVGYGILIWCRTTVLDIPSTLIEPKPAAMFMLQEYYDTILPLTLLLYSTIGHHADVLILIAHLLLFWRRPSWILRDGIGILVRLRHHPIVVR